ncbi:YdiY family protein [Pseudooceanicola sp. LIPI14-2-Ac024]|uniref:DUF481 domain-containing protein n=1 Tax=Pseudooceanicola sp. LIPI14-2-Ac024 TaxID=3344875 RepID=UPI0035CE97A3
MSVATASAQGFSTPAEDRVEDLEDDIEDMRERDIDDFGNEGRSLGWSGSFALAGSGTTGNTETADLGIGARFVYFDGINGHKIVMSYELSTADTGTTSNSLLATYEYTRDFGTQTYFFGKINAVYDEFDSYEQDYFVGAGLGYRILNDTQTQWWVQAGPGWRITESNAGVREEEFAYTVGSYFLYRINDDVYFTNDTRLIGSERDHYVTNDLALNVSMSNQLSLRTGLLTEWHSDPEPGFEEFDNKLAVSLVYSFN